MNHQVYKAIKARIKVLPYAESKATYVNRGWTVFPNTVFYYLNVDGLGDDLDNLILPMQTTNLWNVAQRFRSFLTHFCKDIDARLMADAK